MTTNNGIGTDFRLLVNNLSSQNNNTNIDLNHSIIGQIQNINRAYKIGNSIVPSETNHEINSSNSNINSFIENLPSALGYDIMVHLNPLGNVSGHNDFIHRDYPLSLDIDFFTPIMFSASQLTIADTFEIIIPDTNGINYGSIYLELTNGFPLDAEIFISTLNSPNQLLDPGLISSASLANNNTVTTPTISTHTLNLSPQTLEDIKNSKKIIVSAIFNTANQPQLIDFYDYYSIDFKISADFNTTVSIPWDYFY